ncbi:transcriptional regulator [Desulfitobacterium dichloroeliminans LMG P-21439]|uniref:siroheme decarboxylase n=1 Tax=Desulfitobacterium dichloroeliminans (strain LMG P-21439 / DCA1) TaxID=871963 RepID=L0F7B9_DESDL|nr:AsnC family transcriptional regulator [Desulfitobacterium dichloroeliminans]AGA69739.1 transcriptional regulator [Desulfitobacterium dichloroeliminans LMG P-21439]
MEALDRALLNIVQTDFPVAARPYETLASLTGSTEQEAWQRIQFLRREGIIRRLGGVFDSHRLGYKSTLCAAKVQEDKIQILTDLLMGMPGVTHNYLRNHVYNIWFTLIAPTQREVEKTLTTIKGIIGTEEVYSLPALRLFKISVDFDFNSGDTTEDNGDMEGRGEVANLQRDSGAESMEDSSASSLRGSEILEPYPVDEADKSLIRELQGNIPQSLIPFAEIAESLAWPEEKVLARIQSLQRHKVLRRFGAVLRHQKAGFTANAMGVWQVPEEKAEEIGKIMAAFREVSHCYQRPTLTDWPYNLFTMIHARSEEECGEVMVKISRATGIKDYSMLFSIKELKKSSMQYYREEDD